MASNEWVFLTDESTSTSYYANLSTRETSWKLPLELGGAVLSEPLFVRLTGGWLQFEDEATGKPYYFHKSSQRTTWIMPAEARPPPAASCDAGVFEAGLQLEPEGEGEEEEDDDDDFVDEADDFEGLDVDGDAEPDPDDEEERVGGDEDASAAAPVHADVTPRPPADVAAEKAAKRASRRLKILEEMVTSERVYVQALSTLRRVYLTPLRTVADQPSGKGQIFTHADLDAIFINIDLLIKVNESFLAELETELELRRGEYAHVSFGPIVKRAAKQLKGCYTRYVRSPVPLPYLSRISLASLSHLSRISLASPSISRISHISLSPISN